MSLTLSTPLALGSTVPHPPVWPKDTEISRVDDQGVVYFSSASLAGDPAPLHTGLFVEKSHGLLFPRPEGETHRSLPFIVLTAKNCKNCTQSKSIFLVRADGKKKFEYTFPGSIKSQKSRRIIHDSRAFFGKCLSRNPNDVLVIFQKDRADRRRYLQHSVFVAQATPQGLTEKLITPRRKRPKIKYTLRQVRKQACVEIAGWDRFTQPQVIGSPPNTSIKKTKR